jgi:predicted ATPase/class 3 adenylate cyclase
MAAVKDLPAGTATFVFTDIEGSTRLARELGTERWEEVLEAHARILRSSAMARQGREVRTEGDAFFLVFPSATNAAAAAAEAQRALAVERFPHGVTLRVRMGLHTGEARPASREAGSDYVGYAVHRAARIANAAHGGQVLLSSAVRELVADDLPAGLAVRDLGEHRLKDMWRPERLYQLQIDGVPGEFPPLRTLDRAPHNLPVQLTSFVGREREVAQARRLLGSTRLLTLVGPGGTGKTRLSLQLAAESIEEFPDGVFFAALAPIADPGLVVVTLAQALALHLKPDRPPLDTVAEHLAEKRALLLLDNFEQVLDAAPEVGELLRRCPRLKAVVTSRAGLRISGEQQFPVPPLQLPDPKALPSLSVLSQYEAVRLFIERALAARPDFAVTNENAPAVAEICARLDGLPLAIELAAARIRVLTPQAIHARLGKRLDLLSAGARDLPARQQTLRGAIAWSYDLLEAGAKRLFERLGVFVGGAALEQVEEVCGPPEDVGGGLLDGVAGLVDHSLVRQQEETGEPRFFMLETIREFALERLEASPEAAEIRRRHTRVYLELAERAAPELEGSEQKRWLDALEREHDNLRAVLERTVAEGDAALASRLSFALWRFWHMRAHLHEARERMERVLALPNLRGPERMRALEAAGGVAYWRGDMDTARAFYHEALALARESGDPAAIANAAYNESFTYIVPRQQLEEGRALLEEANAIYRSLGDRDGLARTAWALGDMHMARREYAAAIAPFEEAYAVFRERGNRFMTGWALFELGLSRSFSGQLPAGRAALEDALRLFAEARDVSGILLLLRGMAAQAKLADDMRRAARLSGAATALEQTSGAELGSILHQMNEELAIALEDLDDACQAEWREGEKLSADAAVAYALAPAEAPTPT